MFTEHQVAQRQLHPAVRVRHQAAVSSWVSVEHRDSCRSSPAPGATSTRHEVSRSLKMKSEARRILLYSVLRYSSTARVKLWGVPAARVLMCSCAGNTRYSCTSSSSAAAVSSHSAANLARHSALGWLASTAQYGRNLRNISSSDISTLFREHLRYISLK